ncbi:MAG: type II secretion system protein GspE [Chlamydiae bacterium]|nr:type II secretion system protein GspE [Chlamydiota bacterium]
MAVESNLPPSLEEFRLRYNIDVVDNLLSYEFVKLHIERIPYLFAKNHRVLPLEENQDKVLVAMVDLLQLDTLEELRCYLGKEIQEVLTHKEALEEALEKCYHVQSLQIADSESPSYSQHAAIDTESEGYDLLENKSESPVVQLLNTILIEAIQQGASDIHFEPLEMGLGVRYRIDGVLQNRYSPAREFQSQLITRIKVMSSLDIAEQRLPQDGRMKMKLGGRQIDLRVSTVPCVFGERIVLRILDKSNIMVGLEKIGMSQKILSAFTQLIALPEGIVLVTGPTGSGKTTTLYSALSYINSSEVNVMTIEDPVEYKLQGMAQIGVNPKISLTFATGLRHILRQDPDVIMIGEIRDKETAEIAIQASLTGHLVLSTLHTNDAPSALTRLMDMGIEPYLLSSSVVGVLAQRLVRTICMHCKENYDPTDQELLEMKIQRRDLPLGSLFRGRGCSACWGSGYKGRHAIYELMEISSKVKRQILSSADAHQLQKIAIDDGLKTLRENGVSLVCSGTTTFKELVRATRGCEEG